MTKKLSKACLPPRVHFADSDGLHLCYTRRGYLPLLTTQDSKAVTCEKCIRGDTSSAWKAKAGIERREKRKYTKALAKRFWDEQ